MSSSRTWAEVSLSALRHNYKLIRDCVAPHAVVCAVVKCDAYGHGAAACARTLEEAGATWFAVTCTDEGIELRRAGIRGRILLLSGMLAGEAEAVVEHHLTPAVWLPEHLQELERVLSRNGGRKFPVHVAIDTGMAREGVPLSRLSVLLQTLRASSSICVEGVHSHFASAEVTDAEDVQRQLANYRLALDEMIASGFPPTCVHLANSAAIITQASSWRRIEDHEAESLVRPGIALYGYNLPLSDKQGEHGDGKPLRVTPVLSWKTRVIDLREVPPGQAIGYNGTYTAPAAARIATLSVGYGDGLSRQLSSRGYVLVRGELAPIVGRVSMDLTTIDVTNIPGVQIGEEAVIIGRQGNREITAWDMARLTGTIPYEVLCQIGKRVPRTDAA